ncbi:uncharacterized protein KY384_003903 [Bacidia gigantensis]|uniref:uncharacterized protein n=1 Tax=Bacidia gigantensis TaxID=2732470 RepID=UPI001D03F9FA|nr:uncharacterized protein KY384_003903 [Bacidia gigantensis]KAG8532262.1 hypothetical protein KY384_003903 [Bacidia gigantensis]
MAAHNPAIGVFPTEIVTIILREQASQHQLQLSTRLVSRRFDTLVVAIWFENVTLTERNTTFMFGQMNVRIFALPRSFGASNASLRFASNVVEHTRHLVFDSEFSNSAHCLLATNFQRLDIIEYAAIPIPPNPQWTATLGQLATKSRHPPGIHLNAILSLLGSTGTFATIPQGCVVSLKIINWSNDQAVPNRETIVGNFLRTNLQLKTLHLREIIRTRGTPRQEDTFPSLPRMTDEDRFPALDELVLENYHWPMITTQPWDWSQIVHLEVKGTSILRFLRSITPQSFATLQILRTDGYGAFSHADQFEVEIRTQELITHMRVLRRLSVRVIQMNFAWLHAIQRHGRTLHELSYRLFDRDSNVVTQALPYTPIVGSIIDLVKVKEACANLTELSIDLDMVYTSPSKEVWSNALGQLRNLRRLTVYSNNMIFDDQVLDPRQHFIFFVSQFCEGLYRSKYGAPFEKVTVEIFASIAPAPPQSAIIRYYWNGQINLGTPHGPVIMGESWAV